MRSSSGRDLLDEHGLDAVAAERPGELLVEPGGVAGGGEAVLRLLDARGELLEGVAALLQAPRAPCRGR